MVDTYWNKFSICSAHIVNNTLVSIIQWTHSYKYFQKHAVKPWKQSWINNVNSILIQFCIITLLESEEFLKLT